MKKATSIILGVLTGISAAITVFLLCFLGYDWVMLSNTAYAFTYEFWSVVDYYAIGLLIFASAGLGLVLPNVFIASTKKGKTVAKVMTAMFLFVDIVSLILYLLPFNIAF